VYAYYPVFTRARFVLGVHDAIPEELPYLVFPERRRRLPWRLKGWLAHRQANYVVTVSEYARAGIMRRFGHRPDRVRVVYEESYAPMDMKNMDLRWQNMMAGIEAQVPFVRQSPHVVYGQVRDKLALKQAPSRVYLVGCGDSWYCGLGTRLAFEHWAGIGTEAVQSLEFSRYTVPYAPKDALVVAISNSGRIARTIEAVMRARARGLQTLAGTSALDSRIAQEAELVIDLGYAERRFGPGTSSYMASLLLQYCVALHVAEAAGSLTAAQIEAKLDEIAAEADGMQKTIEANRPVFEELGGKARLTDQFVFIGGGPNYGTAFFSMAKVFEAARTWASGQELEEWAHEQFFCTGEDTYTFVIAPRGASVDRAREQLWAVNEMQSISVAICDAGDHETAALGRVVAPVYGGQDEALSPLSYCLPAELFAFYFAALNNLTMLGFDNPHVKAVNFRQIFDSRIVGLPPG
jgi:glucosamine--fructose-6-phosphate aminotransferase (isomerizing)